MQSPIKVGLHVSLTATTEIVPSPSTPANVHERTYKADPHTRTSKHTSLHVPFTKQYIQIKDFGGVPSCSYLPRLSLLGAGASVPL